MFRKGIEKTLAVIFCIVVAMALFNSVNSAVKIVPVIDVSLLGGQNFFGGKASDFSGYLDLSFFPGFRLGQNTTILAGFNTKYVGVKEVTELLGGGTLYQETWDNFALIKLLQKLGYGFTLKPKFVYKLEWLKETKDEQWTKGLYDYTLTGFGIELTKELSTVVRSIDLAVNSNSIIFPNYKSLTTEAGEKFGSEYSVNAGSKPFDYNFSNVYINTRWVFTKKLTAKFGLSASEKKFIDQNVVTSDAKYIPEKRVDKRIETLLGINYLLPEFEIKQTPVRTVMSFDVSIRSNESNQNHYYTDPVNPKFIPEYYDYTSISVTPTFAFRLAKIASLSIGWDFERRQYKERIIQDTNGNFLTDKLNQNFNSANLVANYNLWKKISVKLISKYYTASSNMNYEKTYRYNYNGFYYFLGANYQY